MTRRRVAFLGLAVVFLSLAVLLSAPVTAAIMGLDAPLENAQQEDRARDIAKSLRCVVCQNQTIDDSDAPLARDMRRLVRERIAAGESDQAVIDYITDRYGDFVLMRPPFQPNTWVLWFAPGAVALAGIAGVALLVRRRRRLQTAGPDPSSERLSAEEEAALDALLGDSAHTTEGRDPKRPS